jgi:uncharacterized protein YukE
MAFEGMDIDAVRILASSMDGSAEQITTLMQRLTQQLQSTDWRGPDRERFLSNWQGQHVPQLNNVVNGLRDASTCARRNAEEQEQVSNR